MLTRRTFIGAGVAAPGAYAIGTGVDDTSRAAVPPRYFLLESYLLKNSNQAQRLGTYFQLARFGMASRLQIVAPTLVLEGLVAAHVPQVLAVSAFASLEQLLRMKRKLREDIQVGNAVAAWKAGEGGPFELSEIVLEAANYCPVLFRTDAPAVAELKPPHVFELRTYQAPDERQSKMLHKLLVGTGFSIFQRSGIRPVVYASTPLGLGKRNLTYLTPFENLAAREKAWAAFGADPEWLTLRADSTASSGQHLSPIQISLFKAASYSPVRKMQASTMVPCVGADLSLRWASAGPLVGPDSAGVNAAIPAHAASQPPTVIISRAGALRCRCRSRRLRPSSGIRSRA